MTTGSQTSYPDNWLFDEHGDQLELRYRYFDTAPTKLGGRVPILVGEVDGQERTIWLLWEPLKGAFREELELRGAEDLEQGERILIERQNGGKPIPSESNPERSYIGFRASFPDRPKRSPASILGGGERSPVAEDESSEEPSGSSDEDVPF